MAVLIAGILLWMSVHLVPVLARPIRQSLVVRLGRNAYRGLFTLAIVGSLLLIVFGWRLSPENHLFILPAPVNTVAFVLICVSFILMGAAFHPSSIKRVVRHPMLVGVAVWASSHLLTSGTTRGLILFGGISIWALIEILLINRRDGAYSKPEAPALSEELKGLFFSAGAFLLLLVLHPFFTGVTPYSF
jgi:uncharacterized membrane protein